jgi:hypothetical protein
MSSRHERLHGHVDETDGFLHRLETLVGLELLERHQRDLGEPVVGPRAAAGVDPAAPSTTSRS